MPNVDALIPIYHNGDGDFVSVRDWDDYVYGTIHACFDFTDRPAVAFKSVETGITASTTQSQGQQPLTNNFNIVSTVANDNDVVTMPSVEAGKFVFLTNTGLRDLQVFPASGDNFNNSAINTSVNICDNLLNGGLPGKGCTMIAWGNNDDQWEYLANIITGYPYVGPGSTSTVAIWDGRNELTDARRKYGSGHGLEIYNDSPFGDYIYFSGTHAWGSGIRVSNVIAAGGPVYSVVETVSAGAGDAYFEVSVAGFDKWYIGLQQGDGNLKTVYRTGLETTVPFAATIYSEMNKTTGALALNISGGGLYCYGVGSAGSANTEFIRMYHSGAGAFINSGSTGTGTTTPLYIQTGGVTSITVNIDQSVEIANDTTVYGIITADTDKEYGVVIDVDRTTSSFGGVYGIYSDVIITDDTTLPSYAYYSLITMTGDTSVLYGIRNDTYHATGTLSNDLFGINNTTRSNNNTVGEDVVGIFNNTSAQNGTSIGQDLISAYHLTNLDGGTVTRNTYGVWIDVDIEAAMTSVGGDVFGLNIRVDDDKGAVGTVYGIYIDSLTGVDYAIWTNADVPVRFGGDAYLNHDGAVCYFGADSEIALAHIHNTGLSLSGYYRALTSTYRRYYHLPISGLSPGASGATWVSADANTISGWQLNAVGELLEADVDIHGDWDGATDPKIELTFTVNVDNSGGAAGDTVDIKIVLYYKGEGENATKTQTIEDAIVVGACAQYTQFKHEFTMDYNPGGGNDLEVGDVISMAINLETDTSEVDDITVNDGAFYYQTTHSGIEAGDA